MASTTAIDREGTLTLPIGRFVAGLGPGVHPQPLDLQNVQTLRITDLLQTSPPRENWYYLAAEQWVQAATCAAALSEDSAVKCIDAVLTLQQLRRKEDLSSLEFDLFKIFQQMLLDLRKKGIEFQAFIAASEEFLIFDKTTFGEEKAGKDLSEQERKAATEGVQENIDDILSKRNSGEV